MSKVKTATAGLIERIDTNYGDTSDNNNLATDSIDCSYCIAIKNGQIFKRIGKTAQKMKILFILSIIETLAFLVGSFMAKTAEMKGRCGEYAMWSMLLCAAIGYIAFS